MNIPKAQLLTSILLMMLLPASLASSKMYNNHEYIPLRHQNNAFTIEISDALSRISNVLPVLYAETNALSYDCPNFQSFQCQNCQLWSSVGAQQFLFFNITGSQYSGKISPTSDQYWGGSPKSISYIQGTSCPESTWNGYFSQKDLITGAISLHSKNHDLDNRFSDSFTVWMQNWNGAPGYIVSGQPDGIIGSEENYLFTNDDWSFSINSIKTTTSTISNQERLVYLDFSIDFIWVPRNFLTKIIDEFISHSGIYCSYNTSPGFLVYYCHGDIKYYPNIYLSISSSSQTIKITPASYIKQVQNSQYPNEIQIVGYSTQDEDYVPKINTNFEGSIILGATFFKQYVVQFEPTSRYVMFSDHNSGFEPNGPSSYGWIWFLVILQVIILFVAILIWKCKQMRKKQVQVSYLSFENGDTKGSLTQTITPPIDVRVNMGESEKSQRQGISEANDE